MFISSVKNKIDCCFAKQVYKLYLNNRYGINSCDESSIDTINELEILNRTFNHYYENMFPIDIQINTGNQLITFEECNISNLIEKINSL